MRSQPGVRYLTVDYSTNPPTIEEDLTEEQYRDTLQHEIMAATAAQSQVNESDLLSLTLKKEVRMSYEGQQASFKLGDVLINITGQTVEDLENNLRATGVEGDNLFELVGEAASIAKQVALAKGLGSVQVSAPTSAPARQNAAPSGSAPVCAHGTMKDLKGKRKANGDGYQNRYVCPAPFKQGCDYNTVKNIPGQEPWSA